ncbi:uncharacterized protein K444DRAFT_707852 [Hyaloscypha bicolor E]|uniref:DUF7025 domain-containing protein n=1 Tax=Hyaloscypha bicolor E TaxID=1095630 RepID=A0A2J6SL78_9HELO|nr:uncharacterized protein K444DRAFT_707852 [Hyaloscypha bicolor E]PMD51470.1 hypothetical protein K444DRAFT_707852 [Hyaloscypha bicolor E]
MPSIEELVGAGLEGGEPTHFLDETEEFGRVTVIFEAGMKCEPKRLYSRYDSSRYIIEWIDEIPDKVTDQAYGYGDAWKEYALLLRTNLEQGEHRLYSIIIQSPLLKSKLNLIFDDYPGFFIGENKSSIIEAPFTPFVHCWDAFTKSCDEKSETGIHMQLLRSALEPELQGSFSTIKEFQSHGMIRFDQLWMIFKPGSFVFSEHSGIERIYKLAGLSFAMAQTIPASFWTSRDRHSQNIYLNAGTLTEQAIFSANKRSAEMEQTELTEDLLMICCSTVRGLRVNFQVDLLRDIEWNADAFESLALPGNHKELLLAFAQTQGDSAVQFDDVIEGKGKGMVVLLEGPPGLGKTLTVESFFLQHLEYFEGTIFLTTNRVECIDPAFESRIHLSLSYPELTRELRHKIWKNFQTGF